MMIIFILSFYLLIGIIQSGLISPSKLHPAIANTITNANQYSNYTFNFILETTIPANSTLKIIFPQQFSSNLGINLVGNTTCSYSCSIEDNAVTFVLPNGMTKLIESSATIVNVKNPTSSGGTGHFQLITMYNTYIFDENIIFGTLGIAPQPGKLTACYLLIVNQSEALAGKTTTYHLSFKTIRTIPYQNFMKLTLPLSSRFSFPSDLSCATYTINGMSLNIVLTCTIVDNSIIFTGFTADIPEGFEVGFSFKLTNPPFAGNTDALSFQIFRTGTTFIYDSRDDIPAITIYPNILNSITFNTVMSGLTISLSKIMDFQLNFTTTNEIPEDGGIYIGFPTTFPLVYNSKFDYVEIISGLVDYNNHTPVAYSYDSSYIKIYNFQAVQASTKISLKFRAITPSISGTSTPLSIYSYLYKSGSTNILQIDSDQSKAKIIVANIPSSSISFPNGLTSTNLNANGAVTTLTFTIIPSLNVPNSGYILIKIPTDWTMNSFNSANCLVNSAGTNSQSCSAPSTNSVLIRLPAATTYYIGSENILTLSGFIKNPTLNSSYIFDISTYQSDGTTLLESFSDYVVLSGAILATASGYLIGSTVSTPPDYIYSILVVKFTLEKDLVYNASKIELLIDQPWDFDLGTGLADNSLIPCQAIANIQNIVCTLRVGSLQIPTKIVVTGYDTVASGRNVEIHFLKLRNPVASGSTNFELYLIQITNRKDYVLNYKSIPITTYASSAIFTSETSTYTTTPATVIVSNSFTLNYLPKFSQAIAANSYILLQFPQYDEGFFTNTSNIICQVEGATYTCVLYPSVQWILITMTTGFTPIVATTTINLQNLICQKFNYAPPEGILSRIIGSVTFEDIEQISLSNFLTCNADTYVKAEVIVDRDEYNAVGCFYSFVFHANNDIPSNSEIYLTFSSVYSLLSTPQPWLVPINLPDYSDYAVVNLLQVKFKILSKISKTDEFSFKIGGVKNPIYGQPSTGWAIEAYFNGNKLNTFSTFTVNFQLSGVFSASYITINTMQAVPSNQGIKSTYTFDFTTNIPYIVPSSAEIYLIFPSDEYISLPNAPVTNVSMGMTYFDSIQNSGSSFLVKTSQILSNSSKRVVFMIKDVRNPYISGQIEGFSIIIIYDGTIIAQTDPSLTYSIGITGSATDLMLDSLLLSPINEAENTLIQIGFDLSYELTSSYIIKLIFPSVYAKRLGDKISCEGVQNINSALSCQADDRILTITGFLVHSTVGTLIINIKNIVNPNYLLNSNTGYFSLAIQKIANNYYDNYIEDAGFFTTSSAAAYCLVSNITISNQFSRLEADYSFNVTFYTSIPTVLALGKVFIEFPEEYDIPDNEALECTVSSIAYGTPSCTITNNVAIINGNTQEFSGNIIIVLKNIKNPTNIGSVKQFFIYSFDGYASEILERSYVNLGTFDFSFVLKGKPVIVNEDQEMTMQVGTQSELIYVNIENPSILNLTFKPLVSGFTVIPSTLTLYAGTISTSFRVAIPETFTIGTYYILWETFNDANLMFTPLKKTTVNVVENSQITIQISTIYNIPSFGESVPISFILSNPPTTQVNVDISFDNITLIKASPSSLAFTAGVAELKAILIPTYLASMGNSITMYLSLSGTSKNSYNLPFSSKTINIVSLDTVAPKIISASISDITRTTALLNIQTDKPVIVYYMIALAGTETPDYEEVSESGPPTSLTTESVYGEYVVHYTANILLQGLLAQKNYTVFVYIRDQSLLTNGPQQLNFQTTDNYRPAVFSVRVNKANVSENEKLWLRENIAYFLALNLSNLVERTYDLGLLPKEVPSSSQSVIYLYLISMPDNVIMPTPLVLANSIQNLAQNISSNYPNFDSTYIIKTAEFPANVPEISYISNTTNITSSSISFAISLNNYGKVFVVAMPRYSIINSVINTTVINSTNTTTNTSNVTTTETNTTIVDNSLISPTSMQIYKGYSRYNLIQDVISTNLEISQKNTNFSCVINGLSQNTSYVLFITIGNVHPYIPDLASNSKIVTMFGNTEIKKEVIIQTTFSEKLKFFWLISLICVLIFRS